MKDITHRLVEMLKQGYCTPQISRMAKKLQEPSTTIHYNIKKLEETGTVKAYKAVFDYRKVDGGLTTFVLISLSPDEYGDPERIAKDLAKHPQIESVDICTGDWEMVIKVRSKDQEEYYEFLKKVISRQGIIKIKSLTSLKQLKTEFVSVA
jgi:Lrp/AsnC family leucine-responsive transcriptional regulator